MPGALDGVRILDLSRYQQGPSSTVLLSDLGAEVIKVEPPGGEPGRGIGRDAEGFSAYFEAHNRGKKSIVLDVKRPEARAALLRLVASCDVVVENYRPGVMEALGLGYDVLRGAREDIILASASAFGREGPWAQRPGFDHIAQAFCGIMVEEGGGPEEEPIALVAGLCDQVSATMLALSVSSALFARAQTGVGQHIDVSLIGTMVSMQSRSWTGFLRTGAHPKRDRYRNATYTHYRCADGQYIALAASAAKHWGPLCRVLERPALEHDARFAGPFDRERNLEALVAELTDAFATRPAMEWGTLLTDADIPNSVVHTYDDIRDHPQYLENGYLIDIEHPNLGPMRVPGPPIHMSATPSAVQGGGAELGQHTEELLLETGFTWDEIEALKDTGVLG